MRKKEFYRPAREEDFTVYMKEFIRNNRLTHDIIELIEGGEISKAIKKLYDKGNHGYYDCHEVCHEYHSLFQAKRDFDNGVPVFVNYYGRRVW